MNYTNLKNEVMDFLQLTPKYSADAYRVNIKTADGILSLPPSTETKHALAVGATGSGKSQLIAQYIGEIIRRGDRGVVLDLKGEFTSYFYRPGIDMILNPLDTRSIKWSIANDINFNLLKADAEVISNSLINDLGANSENEKFFLQAGKNVLKGLIYFALANNTKSNKDIFETIFIENYELIKEMLSRVGAIDALSALGDKRSAQADGVLATAHTWSRAIELLSDMDGDFSIEEWIKNGKGLIFLNASQKYSNIVAPLARFFVDFLLNILLGLGQDLKRRIFIILDEFQNVSAIPSLLSILTLGRSAGASIVAGTQDFGLIDQRYGQNAKTTLINAMNTLYLLRILEPNTAEYLSRAIGESEVEDYSTSSSLSMDDQWDRVNINNNRRNERLVMPIQLTELRDLEFYIKTLKFMGKSKLQLIKRKPVQPAFIPISQEIILRELEQDEPDEEKEISITAEKENEKDFNFS
jgi:type IV secretory pathway TraG/TraD family ATPase VirD4